MTAIHVCASREYDVIIGSGILADCGEYTARAIGSRGKAAVISDENVFPLYAPAVIGSLRNAGFEAHSFTFKGGESTKTLATYEGILSFLSENHFTRSDVLLALGGGIVGDVGGFAAATYQRGISFVQLPTSLLADVDSSIGGKTAVNLASGKNQAGSFYQPSLVLCDIAALATLPPAEYQNGCAEVIKYAILGSEPLFDALYARPASEQFAEVIAQCVRMKRDIVNEDEFDTGKRRLLNLGHTFGHAIEKCSNYAIPHGAAVAIGTAMMTRAAAKRGICSSQTLSRVIELIDNYGLPTATDISADQLSAAALADKKTANGKAHLIVPKRIGECVIMPINASDMRQWLADGGAK